VVGIEGGVRSCLVGSQKKDSYVEDSINCEKKISKLYDQLEIVVYKMLICSCVVGVGKLAFMIYTL
jgi:hypothetical protein